MNFLRRLLGVPYTAATKNIYAETGRLPDSTFWWQQSLRYMHHLTTLDEDHLVLGTFTAAFVQDLGCGQDVRAPLSPLGVTLPHGAHFDPGNGCASLATAAETALMTTNPTSNLTLNSLASRLTSKWSRVWPHYTKGLCSPLWHVSDWASTGSTLIWAALDHIESRMKIGGVNIVPQRSIWW